MRKEKKVKVSDTTMLIKEQMLVTKLISKSPLGDRDKWI